jgi:hypothetical protein
MAKKVATKEEAKVEAAVKVETALVKPTKAGAVAAVEANKGLAAMYADDSDDQFNQSDLLISRVLLAQAMSKYVAAGKANMGQLVGSLEHELLADKGQTLEVIPFHRVKTFRLFKPQPGAGTPKFITEVPYNPETLVWEEKRLREIDWTYVNADKKTVTEKLNCFISWNYYCLLAKTPEALPRVVSFSSTSYIIGKKLGTMILEAKKQGVPMPFKTYKIGAESRTNDKGTFFVFTVDKGRDTTDAELSHVTYWKELAAKGSVRVDDGVDDADGYTGSDSGGPVVSEGVVDQGAEY